MDWRYSIFAIGAFLVTWIILKARKEAKVFEKVKKQR